MRTCLFVEDGAIRTLQVAKTGIGIDGDDEDVPFAFGGFKIANVANMESIEAAVGQDDTLPGLLCLAEEGDEFVARNDFGLGSAHGLRDRLRSGTVNGIKKLSTRNSGGAALHDNKAASNVCDVSSLQGSCTAGERQSVSGENGISRASDIDSLIAAVNGDVRGQMAELKESHAVFATGDEEGVELHIEESGRTAAFEFSKILADGGVMKSFDFSFIGSGRSDSGAFVIGEAITGIEGNGNVFLDASRGGAHVGEIHDTETIV